ncbi:MAG: KpsF/GutQ family sugar-phosphate isomerase [Deltaproteobacteria bacterium]|nr:KpsF/GutQ family sugar-phosphate isomerase [Deltaproteobacteria bacterium]
MSSTRRRRRLSETKIVELGRRVVADEAKALREASRTLDSDFARATIAIADCSGRLVVAGMGKANFVAQKISSTFASTGTPSLFLHPADALHGDLGRLSNGDVVLVLSHSGETDEIIRLLESVQEMKATTLAITGSKASTLGRMAQITIEMGRWKEAGTGLAPTTSTTVMLGLGDALAMAVLELKGFTEDSFRLFHPGGALGRQLMRVRDVMRQGPHLPKATPRATLSEVIAIMTRTPGRPGATTVVGAGGRLVGMFTDGDLRRMLETGDVDLRQRIGELMSASPKVVRPDDHVRMASKLMRAHKIDQVPVVDERGRPVGLLDVQDLLAQRLL